MRMLRQTGEEDGLLGQGILKNIGVVRSNWGML
jgi:hypothetical protein